MSNQTNLLHQNLVVQVVLLHLGDHLGQKPLIELHRDQYGATAGLENGCSQNYTLVMLERGNDRAAPEEKTDDGAERTAQNRAPQELPEIQPMPGNASFRGVVRRGIAHAMI